MGKAGAEAISHNRPKPSHGRGDKYLGEAAQELARRLRKTAHGFASCNCRLPDQAWGEISPCIIEWAEDIHNDVGLWRAVEDYQLRCFGTPLPLVITPPVTERLQGFDSRRIRFLLWSLWQCFNPAVVLPPADPDLASLAEVCAAYLNDRFSRIPRDSGVRNFLAEPDEFGWDLKRKLVWVGCHSYLFRWSFFWTLKIHEEEPSVLRVDEYLARHCSWWSGLGPVEVVASAVNLTDSERADLQRWRERHMSLYRILDMEEQSGYVRRAVARNLVNGESYTIRVEQDLDQCPSLPGRVVLAWLVPWRGEWCWSGEQRLLGELPESEDPKLRQEALAELGNIAYRYCPVELAKAREISRKMHDEFTALYGGDLALFPDGRATETAEQKRLERWRHAHTEIFGLPPGETRPIRFPRTFLENSRGVAAFSSPETGVEYMRDFDLVQSGLAKKGAELSSDERKALRSIVQVAEISPGFVSRVLAEHGPASVVEAFAARDYPLDTALQFLLRRFKGLDYFERYPNISV